MKRKHYTEDKHYTDDKHYTEEQIIAIPPTQN